MSNPHQDAQGRYLCPCCKGPLTEARELSGGGNSTCYIYCPHGRCESVACNDGGEGATQQAAYNALCRAYESELAEQQEGPQT